MQRPFNVVLVFFSRLNLLLVPLISVMLDCCKDDSLKMSVFCWEWGKQEAFTDLFVFGC